MQRTLVLDATGVIYRARDDVAELLVPFITANNGTRDFPAIQDAYIRASLGEMASEEFWRLVGVDPPVGEPVSDGPQAFRWAAGVSAGRFGEVR